jgi:hypothetical protein
MKIKIILAFLVSTLCNAQITLNEMKTILNNDVDYLETFALTKGYFFNKIIDDDKMKGVKYTKGIKKDNHLVLYSSYYKIDKKVFTFQTSSQIDYLSIKKQLIEQEFKLIETYNDRGVLCKIYKNKQYCITLSTGKTKDFQLLDFYGINIEFNE